MTRNMEVTFQPVTWSARDVVVLQGEDLEERARFVIDVFGKTQEGKSVQVRVPFGPYFFVEVRDTTPRTFVADFRSSFARNRDDPSEPDEDLLDASIVKRKKFYGFTNDEPCDLVRLVFKTQRGMRKAQQMLSYKRKQRKVVLYESNVDPILRLLHVADLESAGWIQVRGKPAEGPPRTCCDLEIDAEGYRDLTRVDRDDPAPLVIASFDIECISADGGFPDPEDAQGRIVQIATTFQRYGEPEPYCRHLVSLGRCDAIPGVDLQCFDREIDVLLAWAKALRREHTDVLLGYNTWGFDMNFVFRRSVHPAVATRAQSETFAQLLSKYLREEPAKMIETNLKSSAYGNNEFKTFTTRGMLQIDLLPVMRKEHKLDSYKLDAVAEHFLGDRKVDLPIQEMFRLVRGGRPEDLAKVGAYCVKDTELPLRLVSKLNVLANMIEMAKATHVPLEFLIPRGQQIKAFSQILKMARVAGYVCPTDPATSKEDTYEGATVLDAQTGAYWGVITCLDFASLYPSIMRAHNMCHSTVVLDPRYGNVPGVDYFEVDGVRFAQNRQGILPKLLEDLAAFRKKAKKQQAEAKARGDAFMESLYNGKQLAYKVSMNSVYGFCGAANGFLPCVPIAASVTTVGRNMILKTKDIIESTYAGSQAKVRYGDSVPGYVKGLLRIGGTRIVYEPFECIARKYGEDAWIICEDGEKESCELPDVETLTDEGWTRVHRIIRHVLPPGKRIVRVTTADGSHVDVTDDHSMCLADGSVASPMDLVAGLDRLLTTRVEASSLDDVEDQDPTVASVRVLEGVIEGTATVYDLTTANHRFHAGSGGIVVHNTDSVMVDFGTQDLVECFRLGAEAADLVTRSFKAPISLEFEKCYSPYLLFSKKRYAGLMYTRPEKPDKIDVKGIQLVRRDNCGLVKRVSKEVLDRIMYHRDLEGALEIVRRTTRDLLEGDVDVRELVLSKTLKASAETLFLDLHEICDKCAGKMARIATDRLRCNNAECRRERGMAYKNMTQPHVHVACRIESREPGAGPKANERVPYVFVRRACKLQVDRAEDPGYARDKGMKPDGMYYLEHQLKSPMLQLFEELVPDAYQVAFKDLERKYTNKAKGQREIKDFFGPK
jgi:DNA polymerase delta subunit 1